MTAEGYLNIDAKEETGHQLTDDDIMLLVSREEVPDCDDDHEEEVNDITTKEATHSINTHRLLRTESSNNRGRHDKREIFALTLGNLDCFDRPPNS